jgi:hypothetical protein
MLAVLQSTAQLPPVSIPGSEIRTIISSIAGGQEYELQILLPGSHASSNKKYPVVYLMDSQWDFPLVKSIYGQQYYDGFIPELIIVGVTWGGERPNADSLRARDYTPTKEGRLKQSGGADRFLSFMKNELFPFIENNYKADPSNRTLMGCSLGGLITLYTLFTQPGLFNGYAAASPAIGWDREVLYKYEKDFFTKKLSHPVRVYMTLGDVEISRPGYEKFASTLVNANYTGLFVHSKILENTGHSGTKSETYSRGLQYIFERPDLQPDASFLKKYTGEYIFPDRTRLRIDPGENSLIAYMGSNFQYGLRAASPTDFYSVAQFLNIRFIIKDDKVEGLTMETYGKTLTGKKLD